MVAEDGQVVVQCILHTQFVLLRSKPRALGKQTELCTNRKKEEEEE